MVKGGVGVLRRTNGHIGKVEIVDSMGGDRGGNGIFLPFMIRLADEDSCPNKANAYNSKPQNFGQLCLNEKKSLFILKFEKNSLELKIYD